MPKKRPTDILWVFIFLSQVTLTVWEHGYDRGYISGVASTGETLTTEDPAE